MLLATVIGHCGSQCIREYPAECMFLLLVELFQECGLEFMATVLNRKSTDDPLSDPRNVLDFKMSDQNWVGLGIGTEEPSLKDLMWSVVY